MIIIALTHLHPRSRGQTALLTILSTLFLIASTIVRAEDVTQRLSGSSLPQYVVDIFGIPPRFPEGLLNDEVNDAVDAAFGISFRDDTWKSEQSEAVEILSKSGDPRLAWLLSDMIRISGSSELTALLADAAGRLLNITFEDGNVWNSITNHLMAWDVPAPPNYLNYKRNIYTLIVPEWGEIFTEGDIDWRYVSWGGVRIDNRAYNETDELCNCIPATDNPGVSTVSDAKWLKEDDIVFGVEINGEYRAYPRRIMEVREMVNDTLGGRDIGIPYCTLCGSAQVYFTDDMPEGVERPILRTSGLLIRSNKVMYDLNTFSVFDTFRGQAVTGPLANNNVVLKQAGVVTTEWGEWKSAHPETTVLNEQLALGRNFDFRNNRDANGPIFPIGDVDPRLPVQEDIVGLISDTGIPIAFHRDKAIDALRKGEEIMFENIRLVLDGGGVRAVDKNGKDLGGHQAFWFAWSQFHPNSELWPL